MKSNLKYKLISITGNIILYVSYIFVDIKYFFKSTDHLYPVLKNKYNEDEDRLLPSDFRIRPIFLNHHTFDYKAVKPAFGREAEFDVNYLMEFFHNDTDDRKKDCKSKIIHKVRRNAKKYESSNNLHVWWMNFWGTSSIIFSEYEFSDIYTDDGTGSLRNEKALRDKKWHDFTDLIEYNAAIKFIYDKQFPYIDIRLLWLDRNYKENLKDKNLKAGTKLNFTYYRGDRISFCSSINTQIFLRGYVKESVDISDEQTIQMTIIKDISALDLFENYLSNPVVPRFSTYGGFCASLEPDAEDPNLWNAIVISKTPKIFDGDGYSRTDEMSSSSTYNDILFEFIKGLAYQFGQEVILILL
jgi:hypothetical protein